MAESETHMPVETIDGWEYVWLLLDTIDTDKLVKADNGSTESTSNKYFIHRDLKEKHCECRERGREFGD